MNECIYCKSTEIEKDLPVIVKVTGQSPAAVGPFFSVAKKKFLGKEQTQCAPEPMFVDLCKKCGGVKLFVKNIDKDWQKEFPSPKNGMFFV